MDSMVSGINRSVSPDLSGLNDSVALQLRDISHSYGSLQSIQSINLSIRRHEFVAIVGPSGCGKSTLLSILSGFIHPASGVIEREGNVRMIYQQGGLFPWMTVTENISLGLRRLKNKIERLHKLQELITLIGMNGFEQSYPHQLSGGMQQRVELARALADETDILLMDEPFSSLDYLTRLKMRWELMRMLNEKPRTVVFVTHDVEEAVHLADRVAVLTPRPSTIQCEISLLSLPHPRRLSQTGVVEAARTILKEMGLEEEV